MTFGFVILHYKIATLNETIDCVQSIIKLKHSNNFVVVIVDNGSNDGSFENISNYFKFYSYIKIIKNKENLGFAKGNNVGYSYLRNFFNCNFIACLNNDTVILSNDFVQLVENEYLYSGFHILGPKIILKDGKLQNPIPQRYNNISDVDNEIKNLRFLLLEHNKVFSISLFINWVKEKLRKVSFISFLVRSFKDVFKLNKRNVKIDRLKRQIGINLHGSFILFSKKFIEESVYAFFPGTFLYLEEDILFFLANKKAFTTVYYPAIEVFHKEDASTNTITTKKNKAQFIIKHALYSLTILKELFENDFHS
jgi:GT2 family glycosyltransferase